ncbi:MAG: four helix bundle suffix domain-containing protein [Patescibacteria group bacterium]
MSYKELKSYEQAKIVYDFTVEFCDRYIDKSNRTNKTYRSRMYDQMVQAARSGKQNIAEGSANPTSEKSELKLLGVARASFQELLEDYEDFLRQRGLRQWDKESQFAQLVRQLAYGTNRSYTTYKSYMSDPEVAANCALCLIHQVNFLLDRQIRSAESQFVRQGGYTEKLAHRRGEEVKKRVIGRTFRKYE